MPHPKESEWSALSRILAHRLAGVDTIAALSDVVIAEVVNNLGLEMGSYWQLEKSPARLHCEKNFHSTGINKACGFSPCHNIDCCLAVIHGPELAMGEGLPGRVWETGEPVFFDGSPTHSKWAKGCHIDSGFRWAFAFPLHCGNNLIGIFDFVGSRAGVKEDQVREPLARLSRQISGYAIEVLNQSPPDPRESIAAALPYAIGRHDAAGRLMFVNPPFEQMVSIAGRHLLNKTLEEAGYEQELSRYWTQCVVDTFRTKLPASFDIALGGESGASLWNTRFIPEFNSMGHVSSVLSLSRPNPPVKQAFGLSSDLKLMVLDMIASASPLAGILGAICMSGETELEGVACAVMLSSSPGMRLEYTAAARLPEDFISETNGMTVGPCVAACGAAAFGKKPVDTPDIATDPSWLQYRDVALRHGLLSCSALPIMGRGSLVLGVFVIYRTQTGELTPREAAQAKILANLAGIAIQSRQSRQALEHSERRFRSLIETTRAIVAIVSRSRIAYVNSSVQQILGYTPDQLSGNLIFDLIEEDDQPGIRDSFARLMRGESQKDIEVGVRHRDGSLHILNVNTAVFDDTSPRSFVITAHDITESKRIQGEQNKLREALAFAAGEWRTTFDSVALPILILDQNKQLVRLNRAAQAVVDLPYQEIIGRPITDFSGELWQAAAELLNKVQGSVIPISSQVIDEATRRTWELVANVSKGPDGFDRYVLVAKDITRLIALQESLRRTETLSAMGSLVAGVAHEVRNPLFAISATLDAFEAQTIFNADFQGYATVLRKEIRRLGDLMQDLLEYGRPPQLYLETSSLTSVIEDCLARSGSLAKKTGIVLEFQPRGEVPPIGLDVSRLKQVLTNLIENAIQHSSWGGRVWLELYQEKLGDQVWVCVTVNDMGPGVPEEDLPRLFEPFFTRRRGGTGLGLAIVHQIMKQHEGSVGAQSREGGGASFTLRLPLKTSQAPEDGVDQKVVIP